MNDMSLTFMLAQQYLAQLEIIDFLFDITLYLFFFIFKKGQLSIWSFLLHLFSFIFLLITIIVIVIIEFLLK